MKSINKIIVLATLSAFVFSALIAHFPVSALEGCAIPDKTDPKQCLDDFFGSNDIIYYDPNADECVETAASSGKVSSDSPLLGNSNAEKIFLYLITKGLTAEQSAGILGNLQQESGFDPAIEQGGRIVDASYRVIPNLGFGIAQWTDPGRQANLTQHATSSNRTIIDLSMQLDFLWIELSATPALATLKAQSTPEDAARSFHADFEKSADNAAGIQLRANNARKLFDEFKNLSATADSTGTSDSGATSGVTDFSAIAGTKCSPSSPTSRIGAGLASFMTSAFVIYTQCDHPPYGGSWGTLQTPYGGTMCDNAGIPTSLAMISKNLAGKDVDPRNTIDYYTSHGLWYPGGGSTPNSPIAASTAFGVKAETMTNKGDLAAYKDVFDKGGLVMAISTGSSPFTSTRNAIVLRGITPEGKFLIADPGRSETNESPVNELGTDKILTDIRSDKSSISYVFYK